MPKEGGNGHCQASLLSCTAAAAALLQLVGGGTGWSGIAPFCFGESGGGVLFLKSASKCKSYIYRARDASNMAAPPGSLDSYLLRVVRNKVGLPLEQKGVKQLKHKLVK